MAYTKVSLDPKFYNHRYEYRIDSLSYITTPLYLVNYETDQRLAYGTGFFYAYGDQCYLITNWHNVTGINPETHQRLLGFGASPTAIEFALPYAPSKSGHLGWQGVVQRLYEDKKPKWLIHPTFKEKVDVVAIKMKKKPEHLDFHPVNKKMLDSEVFPRIGDDVYLLGYPEGLSSGGNFPIWKRGSIASEPDLDFQELPKMIVDTASRQGMSGSPVIFRKLVDKERITGWTSDKGFTHEMGKRIIQNFCGVYSGRIATNSSIDTQLGIVWKPKVIEEIIGGSVRDRSYYPEMSFPV